MRGGMRSQLGEMGGGGGIIVGKQNIMLFAPNQRINVPPPPPKSMLFVLFPLRPDPRLLFGPLGNRSHFTFCAFSHSPKIQMNANIPPEKGQSPQPKLSIHSGNGNLRGGGVRQNGSSATFLKLGQKLEGRLGPVILICFVTVGVVLAINGIFHESTRTTMLELVEGVQREMLLSQQNELAKLAGIETTTAMEEEKGEGENGTRILVDGGAGEGGIGAVRELLKRRAEQLAELDSFRQRLNETDLSIWALVMLAAVGAILMGTGVFVVRMRAREKVGRNRRMAYKALLLFAALLLLIQLFLLLFSLLPNSIALPQIVDRLLLDYLAELPNDRRQFIVGPVEDGFACKMKVDHELLEALGFQKQCLPNIKDRLLAPYIVLFLILVVIFPFIFAIFTFFWVTRLKNYGPVRKARKRVELNQGEKRPQSREEILARALGANSTTNDKAYY